MRFRPLVACLIPLTIAAASQAQNGDRACETQGELPAAVAGRAVPGAQRGQVVATFAIADGYHIELVAAEPLVEAPVAFEFGPDGRLWVVEMRGYMRDAEERGEGEPLGRIKVLATTPTATALMDRCARSFSMVCVMPRGIAHWRDGLLVIEPPHLLFCATPTATDARDESRVVARRVRGQGDNPEHAGNGLYFWTLDNAFTCSQHPTRFVPDGDELRDERVSPHGQWGISEDDDRPPVLLAELRSAASWTLCRSSTRRGIQRRSRSMACPRAPQLTCGCIHRISRLGVNRGYQKGVLKDGRLANFTGACSPHVHERRRACGADMDGCALVCRARWKSRASISTLREAMVV
jgi:hypothetical protein